MEILRNVTIAQETGHFTMIAGGFAYSLRIDDVGYSIANATPATVAGGFAYSLRIDDVGYSIANATPATVDEGRKGADGDGVPALVSGTAGPWNAYPSGADEWTHDHPVLGSGTITRFPK